MRSKFIMEFFIPAQKRLLTFSNQFLLFVLFLFKNKMYCPLANQIALKLMTSRFIWTEMFKNENRVTLINLTFFMILVKKRWKYTKYQTMKDNSNYSHRWLSYIRKRNFFCITNFLLFQRHKSQYIWYIHFLFLMNNYVIDRKTF